MKKLSVIISLIIVTLVFIAALTNIFSGEKPKKNSKENSKGNEMTEKVLKSDEEWKEILTPEQYYVTRQKGTERPFSGKYDYFFEKGIYKCINCGADLFESDTKFDAGCGWPSFYDVMNKENVSITKDYSHGMVRDEVTCKQCGAHLGHVFDDGPNPTGKRYCINSVSLDFDKK